MSDHATGCDYRFAVSLGRRDVPEDVCDCGALLASLRQRIEELERSLATRREEWDRAEKVYAETQARLTAAESEREGLLEKAAVAVEDTDIETYPGYGGENAHATLRNAAARVRALAIPGCDSCGTRFPTVPTPERCPCGRVLARNPEGPPKPEPCA